MEKKDVVDETEEKAAGATEIEAAEKMDETEDLEENEKVEEVVMITENMEEEEKAVVDDTEEKAVVATENMEEKAVVTTEKTEEEAVAATENTEENAAVATEMVEEKVPVDNMEEKAAVNLEDDVVAAVIESVADEMAVLAIQKMEDNAAVATEIVEEKAPVGNTDEKATVNPPAKIRSFIDSVTIAPLQSIEKPLRSFVWEFEKGDFYHWVDLFNHFDAYFGKFIKPRKDLQLEDNFLECDPPFPKEAVLQILRVISIILENCPNKKFSSSYEHHLSLLLASTYADVVEACLKTLAAFLKKSIGKDISRDASFKSKLSAFAQGWGSKEEGLGLIACALQNGFDPHAYDLGSTLHFEFYAVSECSNVDIGMEPPSLRLKVIHLPDVDSVQESDLELLSKLTAENTVPLKLRFSLLTRLRFARAFSSLAVRHQYICIRLYAFIVLVQVCGDSDDLSSFFNMEPDFINQLVNLLSHGDEVPEKIRILSLQSLVALCHDRSRQPSVLAAVTSGGHGILSSLMQKAIDAVINDSVNSFMFAEALLSLVSVLVSSSSGCLAMREAGFIPVLLPLLKDANTQHLHLVSAAVNILEAIVDYSNPGAAPFRNLDDAISLLEAEMSRTASVALKGSVHMDTSDSCSSQGGWPLPHDLTVMVFRKLDARSLCVVACTCHALNRGAMDPRAYVDICLRAHRIRDDVLLKLIRRAFNDMSEEQLRNNIKLVDSGEECAFGLQSLHIEGLADSSQNEPARSQYLSRAYLLELSGLQEFAIIRLVGDKDGPEHHGKGCLLKKLVLINVGCSPANTYTFYFLRNLKHLEIIDRCCEVPGVLKRTKDLPMLETLIASRTTDIQDDRFGVHRVSESLVTRVTENCPEISILILRGCVIVGNAATILMKGLPKLKLVDIPGFRLEK